MTVFHKTIKWKSKREKILKRDEYMCRECKRYGKTTEATMVHHVIPLDQRIDLGLNSKNLISLCKVCHGKMHDRVSDLLTILGNAWVDRIYKK